MWRDKRLLVVLAALSVIFSMLIAEGCTKSVESDDSQTQADTEADRTRERIQPQMHFDEVAEILGIDQQELEDAYLQAQTELADSDLMGPRPEGFPEQGEPPEDFQEGREPPEGFQGGMETPPEDFSDGMGPPMGGMLPEAILARMAEILNIDQQELADAFAQVQGTGGNE